MTPFLSSYLISNDGEYPKVSTSPQLHHFTFPTSIPSVTLWIFLDFSNVIRISCFSSKPTSFTSKLSGPYQKLTKVYRNNCYSFKLIFRLHKIGTFQNTYKLNWHKELLSKCIFEWGRVILISYADYPFTIRFISEVFPNLRCVIKLFSIVNFVQINLCVCETRYKKKRRWEKFLIWF